MGPFIYYVSTKGEGAGQEIVPFAYLKFIYSEKATKFCKIFPLLLTTVHTVKSKGKISQNFVAFSEYMNFINSLHLSMNAGAAKWQWMCNQDLFSKQIKFIFLHPRSINLNIIINSVIQP